LGKEELYGNSSRIRVKKSWKQKWLRKAKFFVVHLWSLKKGFRVEKSMGRAVLPLLMRPGPLMPLSSIFRRTWTGFKWKISKRVNKGLLFISHGTSRVLK
jgi:hypothetical protein